MLELLVVLFIMGLAYALAAPMIGTGVTSLELKSSTRQLAAGLRKTRSVAMTKQHEAILTIDVGRHTFTVTGDEKIYPLPKQIEINLITAQTEQIQDQIGNIRFFPDGTATGGRITLSVGESRQTIDIDWLTGKIVITP